ncbi:hypothetical protein AKO1_009679 [Acrasis kona]|uniref:Uncharacterized protein n=1 Tax=Acrasis kona TaxID=1008807 RepID=A0AAW2ZP12_9EUKA
MCYVVLKIPTGILIILTIVMGGFLFVWSIIQAPDLEQTSLNMMFNNNNQTDFHPCKQQPGFQEYHPMRFYFEGDPTALYCGWPIWITVIRIIITIVMIIVSCVIGLTLLAHKWWVFVMSSLLQLIFGVLSLGVFIVDAYYSGTASVFCNKGMPGADLQGRKIRCDMSYFLGTIGADVIFSLFAISGSILALVTSRPKFWARRADPHREIILDQKLADIRKEHKERREEEEKSKPKGFVWDE